MSRTSTRLFVAAAVLGMVAFAGAAYLRKVKRDFSAPTTITMGTVLKHSTGSTRRGRRGSELFCWVSYEFTPPDGVARRNWRFWRPACGVSPGRPIPIQHSIANPDVNRPAESGPWFPASLLFFAAGVTVVVGVIIRRSEEDPGTVSHGIDL
jgi:hypothetical protein